VNRNARTQASPRRFLHGTDKEPKLVLRFMLPNSTRERTTGKRGGYWLPRGRCQLRLTRLAPQRNVGLQIFHHFRELRQV
jgi:hypothetical protein